MHKKILAVDDEPLILTTIERALSKIGFVTVRAQNMKEVDSAIAAHAPFDLLITDVHLEQDDVDDIIMKVRHSSPSAPVLMISGSLNMGKYPHFIEKPFSIEDLRRKVRELVDEESK